jgi:4-hydroxy-tetrahydrodipicolinate synthase
MSMGGSDKNSLQVGQAASMSFKSSMAGPNEFRSTANKYKEVTNGPTASRNSITVTMGLQAPKL